MNYQRKGLYITVEEIHNTTLKWIRNTQETMFQEEIKCLTEKSTKKLSTVRQLKLYMDEQNILRCGGRIDNAPLSETTRYPYLLPTKHTFTTLVIMDAYFNQLHGGVNITVTHLRKTYWILKISQSVKTILRKCVTCRKVIGKTYPKQDPPPLPQERVQETTPFSVTGVDFAGPLYVKNYDNTKSKVYICLAGITLSVANVAICDFFS